MKQVLLQRGKAVVDDVPAPILEPGCVLVRVHRSCISVGTELSGLKRSGLPLWQLAMKYPQHVKKAIDTVATMGVVRTWGLVQGQLSAGIPLGYSAAGIVVEVGEGVEGLRPGDRVACAGAQCSHHAEVIRVPRNLVAAVPDAVSFDDASTVTLGAIAMQGTRRANPTLGETFVVIGLGALGQLAAQILQASGARVIAADLNPARVATARELGVAACIEPGAPDVDQVFRMTGGVGADGVIITAATASDAVVSTAFKMCRQKGRVVLVGDVGLNLNRADLYKKELDFFISCSYGPGRYDERYEEDGVDYPIGYVRWTEQRNMAEYLRLIADQRVKVAPLVSSSYPVERAEEAYSALDSADRPLLLLLSYPEAATVPGRADTLVKNPKARPAKSGAVRLALVGAGGFAKGVHLPNIHALGKQCHLRAVISRSGHNAAATARRWGADYAGTDFRQVLEDRDIDAVVIATRHHLHAEMALAALRAGKHVLLEKPLALTTAETDAIEQFFADTDSTGNAPVLLTGFNRRFSPHVRAIREWTRHRTNPLIINYRMNAGFLPASHWLHNEQGGGRNLGEACHIYDLFTYLTGARVERIQVSSIRPTTDHYKNRDNFTTSIAFDDGSVATLTYTSLGSKEYPKEQLEAFVDGQVIALNDYKSVTASGAKKRELKTRLTVKGQAQELEAFLRSIQEGGSWPIALWEQLQATRIALQVEQALNRGR